MKRVQLFSLLCGLLCSPVWGQSVDTNQQVVVVRYVALSCNSARPFNRKAKPEVILGSFDSFRATILNDYPRLVLWQASGSDKEEEMEMMLRKTSAFSLPAVIVGVKTAVHTEPLQGDMIQPAMVHPAMMQSKIIQPETIQPATIQSVTIQPEMIQPATIQPVMMQPEMIQSVQEPVQEKDISQPGSGYSCKQESRETLQAHRTQPR